MNIELEIKDIKHDLNYAKKCEYDHVTLDVYKVQALLTAYEKEKEKRENQQNELTILNAKQIEFNKLVNTVNSYKGQFKRQEKEIEELKNEVMEQELIIDGMKEDRRIAVEEIQEQYYVSKDKIKAKIEELERQEKEESDAFLCKRVLQLLLEKE